MGYHATFSPRGLQVSYAGVLISDGKSDGDFLTISQNSDRVNIREGMDGNASISVLPNHSVTVTYTVFPESSTAKKLMAIDFALREAERFGSDTGVVISGQLPFTITDDSGAVVLFAENAVLVKAGDMTFGESTGTQEYTFYLQNARLAKLPDSIANEVNGAIAQYGLSF